MNIDRPDDISEDVYVGFVRSLFRDAGILLVGAFTQGAMALLVYWKTSAAIYLALAILMVAASIGRYLAIRRVSPDTIVTYESALAWERYYIVAGTIHGSAVGLFAFVCLYVVPDLFGEIAAVSLVLASTITIAGRNFGSRKMVAILSVSVVAPIAVGLMLKGDVYNVILGLFVIPFMFTINKMAHLVRKVLFTAISEEKKANRLAQRFNRALNTMSHGLVMLGPDGRVVVANAEAAHLMSLKSPDALLGRSIHGLLMRGVAGGMLAPKDCRYIEAQLTRALREGRDRKVLVSLANGQHYEFSAREGSQQLGVITFEDVTARVEAESKIRFMARYDSLTGLPNRAYFQELIGEAMASGDLERLCGLAVLDLDDFKNVNDTLGHPVGDGLIYAVAERLAAIAGPGVTVSRFGGDEFMIFFDRVEDESHLTSQIDGIFDELQGEVDVAGHGLRIQASGGAVLSRVRDTDVDAMIVKADLALYKAKELGKNTWRLFQASMDAAFRDRQLMKADLRTAVESKALRVVYQPIVAMSTMRIASCEALCRWDHPDLGPISPSIFIPLAEEMGIISEISTFVLQAACAECVKWPDPTSVSVNLSAKDFRSSGIVQKVRDALANSGLSAGRLEIEVTETALLDDKSLTRQYIEELKRLGVRIALDDFGTGYSSLSYLHKLPLDKVKIDRSFLMDVTHNPSSLALLKGVVELIRVLGLNVTIEGVETYEQLNILTHSIKPDMVQGFLFGSALTASGIGTMATTVWPFAIDKKPAGKRALS
ncbi:MAG: EAL domain-containing protein [Mesorhizobium sp.]|jgi:diguanylate cyclase (GGDEF)-like protein|uniref:putative bifunctional diguanylate cyclase/phosphodiesterase n=1 Tax=unclassified Mesorhizobium TaxID=325217 RepID=UPI0004813B01|nr:MULTISPECIES: EAL domain-containing protein [unclassified Mesorhizobium]RWC03658.1 MAG: EAL domain-containing protein [Mesorhizobium sp.]RWO10334.1 MAG: EAL domain-containing protein [Mesorhizobium sp.]RWO30388.1 MAG: EAL domain-containing protein [Mesorhizobium sp.]RWP00764.1 MAG: EAL domain-containing protein [Mesorhizobium sp.]RWP62064.1 MAG: EAL domain-containing protein [Mesorhizobium sp.]